MGVDKSDGEKYETVSFHHLNSELNRKPENKNERKSLLTISLPLSERGRWRKPGKKMFQDDDMDVNINVDDANLEIDDRTIAHCLTILRGDTSSE